MVVAGSATRSGAEEANHTVSSVSAGVVIGILEAILALSFAALIFAGELSVHLPAASAIALVGAAIVLGGTALTSSVPGMIGSVQDTSGAILALVAASVATQLDPTSEAAFSTIVLAMVVSAALSGGVFLVLGFLRFGDLIRYVPHPVIGGFLAGTGWLLVKGSVGVLSGISLSLGNLGELAEGAAVAKWLPGVALAGLLMFVMHRHSHPLILPGGLLLAASIFYLVVFVSEPSVSDVEAGGWLMGPFESSELWQPWAIASLVEGDWSVLLGEAGTITVLALVALIAALLNASGVELTLERDADLNRELVSAGGANAAAAVFGGIPGYQALSLTALTHRLGGRDRLPGVVAALVCAAGVFLAPVVLGLFPRFLLGGLLFLIGAMFLMEWLVDGWVRLPRAEFAIVVTIVLVIAATGFLEGVAVGVVLSIFVFVASYSREDAIKHQLSGAAFRSNVERPVEHLEVLRERGDTIMVLELQGSLFFGTAHRMLERIRRGLNDRDGSALSAIVMDFRNVTGVDSSAMMTFVKLGKLARKNGFALVLSGLDDNLHRRISAAGLHEGRSLRIFPDVDRALEWCEEVVLAAARPATPPGLPAILHEFPELQGHLVKLEVAKGETLIRVGDDARDIYFLQSGRLTAQVPGLGRDVRLRSMLPGTIVGEVGAYAGGVRSASVVAEEFSIVYRLSLDHVQDAAPETAAALHKMFASLMAQRLADNLRVIKALGVHD